MSITVEATYEKGVLKLLQPLPLQEHERVKVTIHTRTSVAEQTAGMLKWTGDPRSSAGRRGGRVRHPGIAMRLPDEPRSGDADFDSLPGITRYGPG